MNALTESSVQEFVDRCVEQIGSSPDKTLPLLQAVQKQYGYLPPEALQHLSRRLGRSPAELWGVATFYDQFRFKPAGRHRIRVCVGTACHVKGAGEVFEAFRRHLQIPREEDTDSQRLFTVEQVACLGCCMLAPAVQIDDVIYGYLSPEKVPSVLRDFLSQTQTGAGASGQKAVSGGDGEIRICLDTSCRAVGSHRVYQAFEDVIRRDRLGVRLRDVSCHGASYLAPLVEVETGGRIYRYGCVKPSDAEAILHRHFRPQTLTARIGSAVRRFLDTLIEDRFGEPPVRFETTIRNEDLSGYLKPQVPLATDGAGRSGPLDWEDFQKQGGLEALRKCLFEKSPQEVLKDIEQSGLRGRGGGGYPAFRKWQAVRDNPDTPKYIICNGDEGDPGAFMDRMLMESYPFRILEGMVIAAWTVGASQGYLYIRDEYPLAVERMKEALKIFSQHGWLGEHIGGTDFSLQLEICTGAGAFVCGEETALIASIEGRRPMPRLRPPYPSEKGLWGKPTLIHNAETLSLVPAIVRQGAASMASIGTAGSRGTKVFALAGKVRRGGLVEVPMGVTIRRIVEEIGGGTASGKPFKAVQIGGPSGGCIPASMADIPIDYDSLTQAGAMMGSGGLVVLDESDCMVEIARYFLEFTQRQSCGRCTFCRVGTKRMLEILERICRGEGTAADLGKLETLGHLIQAGSLCGLGSTAPNPVLSTLRYFREEYEAHLQGRCPAGRCRALIHYTITDRCIGCTRCAQHCPAGAIEMQPYQPHQINQDRCIRCGTCRAVCPADAVCVESGR
ncbi:MAG: NAD(P)H-dependent oxidoreductase subunit E [Anaerohalosphaeraceae bacterium]